MDSEGRNNKQVWIFGYGSIVWKPDFPSQLEVTGHIKGYARRFWQGSMHHRGKPGDPGRVVTLIEDQHECTYGLAFNIKESDVQKVMDDLNEREKGYITKYVLFYPTDNHKMPPFKVLCYIATESNPDYLGPAPVSTIARQIVNAAGQSGCNVEYLMKLARSMREIAPLNNDEHLFTLEAEVIKLLPVNGTTCNCFFCTGKVHDGDRTLN